MHISFIKFLVQRFENDIKEHNVSIEKAIVSIWMSMIDMKEMSFEGDTFVAYIDISGFKKMMNEKKGVAWKSLDLLYNLGYNILQDRNNEEICGIFVSDCGILYIKNNLETSSDHEANLVKLLAIIKKMNEIMLENNFMLTTSISYGEFKYQDRIVIPTVNKSPVYGGAYIKAYSDNEHGNPKIKPGQCRIIKDNLPSEICKTIEEKSNIFGMVQKQEQHYYYYWMCRDPREIRKFKVDYKKAYECRYEKLRELLKENNRS